MAKLATAGIPTGEAIFRRAVVPRAALYAVVDAARVREGAERARAAGVGCNSLWSGALGLRLRHIAPYLVAFEARSPFGQWWFEQWGRSVGVLVEAPVSLAELRAHLRTLLIIRHADRRKYYFRFYDPRVLRVFLPSCTADEVKRFFGPITAIYCEGVKGTALLAFRPDRDGVSVKQNPVEVPARDPRRGAGRS